MVLGIDASNIKSGGGLTHLKELLEVANPQKIGIKRVIVYGGRSLQELPERDWLIKKKDERLNQGFIKETFWKLFTLPKLLKSDKISILFNPGGSYIGSFKPFVTMSQNMLVFDQRERARFGFSSVRLRLKLLNFLQTAALKKATGVIFISEYAQKFISQLIQLKSENTIIHHGISYRFVRKPEPNPPISAFTADNPFVFLYISIVDAYKHQTNVIKAVAQLRDKGLPISLHLVGPAAQPSLGIMSKEILYLDPKGLFIKYLGSIPFSEIEKQYHQATAFVFASTCENMPNILIEAMSAGLPIASSDYAPMPEFLKDAGLYFDPLDVNSISATLENLVMNSDLQYQNALKAYQYAAQYSWKKCADESFAFIKQCYDKFENEKAKA